VERKHSGKAVLTAGRPVGIGPSWRLWLAAWLALVSAAWGQTDGVQRWAFTMGSSGESSATVASDGTVYVGAQLRTTPAAGKLWAINRDGSRKWSFDAPDWIDSSPAVGNDGSIYFGCWDGVLYALNPEGRKRWEYRTGAFIFSSPAVDDNGTIYVGGGDALLHAIGPDGVRRWTFAASDWVESPSIGPDGNLYFGSWDKRVYSVSPEGVERWRFTTGGEVFSAPAFASDGTVYVTSNDGSLYALSAAGRLRWSFKTEGAVLASPVTGPDGTIYFGSMDRNFYAVTPQGALKWRVATGKGVQSTAAVRADGVIIFGGADNSIRALNADGSTRWTRTTGDMVLAAPVVAPDGSIYVGCYDGKLYAIEGSGSPLSTLASWPALGGGSRRSGRAQPLADGRLLNMAIRAEVGGAANLIVGWSIRGSGDQTLLIRAVGPGLAQFGLPGYLPDPTLTIKAPNGQTIVENQDWDAGGQWPVVTTASLALGAFPLGQGSGDAALLIYLAPGNYTALIGSSVAGARGVGLLEVYDASLGQGSARLVNLSSRGFAGSGAAVIIPGLVVGGGPVRALVRAVGPGLVPFGVNGVLARPTMTLFSGSSPMLSNSSWEAGGLAGDMASAAASVGAFPLAAGSPDCAMLVRLQPGIYTVQVGGADGGTGQALVEIYLLD